MKKVLILLLALSCQSNDNNRDHKELAYSVFETLKMNDFDTFQTLFMPHKVNGVQADGVNEDEYYNFALNSFTKSREDFKEKELNIEDFRITEITELTPRLSQRVYGGKKFEFFEFYVVLKNYKNESFRAQMKCIKIDESYWFRDDLTVIRDLEDE